MTPRLFIDAPLAGGALVDLGAGQAHYLRDVLRLAVGASVKLFNGHDGEWQAAIEALGKRAVALRIAARRRPPALEPDLWLCFAPVKRARLDFIAEKATELGASALRPVITQRTIVTRINLERLSANAIEAAEQTERLTVPQVAEPAALDQMLSSWPEGRRVLLADETGGGEPIAEVLARLDEAARAAPWAVLVGPEGGFTRAELDAIGRLPHAHAVGLGPRILRADTAAVAALAIWQALVGDWRRATPRRWPDYAAAEGE